MNLQFLQISNLGGGAVQFLSLAYVVFLAFVAVVYSLLPVRARRWFLLAASWLFYGLCDLRFLPLLLASTVWNYAVGLAMGRWPGWKRALLAAGLGVNLGMLFLFKYLGFFGSLAGISVPSLLLPAGISFYTFTVCGYLIDLFRGTVRPERNFCAFALFVSFFPAILSGPIERNKHLAPQLSSCATPTGEDRKIGVTRFLTGMAKKLILADRLAILVNTAYGAPETCTGVQLLAATLAYAVQIYCDFSAYSDMAIGSARLLGIRLTENFHAPYLARSVKEFWRRWHISLSTWFRDYLYFPLGGSRRGRLRTWCNVLIVFTISGLWHGAAMTFVVWGLLNGVYQVAESALQPLGRRLSGVHTGHRLLPFLQTVVTFLLISLSWVFFRAASLEQALLILSRIATMAGGVFPLHLTALGLSRARLLVVALAAVGLLLADLFRNRWDLSERLCGKVWLRYGVWVALILATVILGAYGDGFDPQEFVYFKF